MKYVPRYLVSATVVPMYKEEDRGEPQLFRQIFLLSCLRKIVELSMVKQTRTYTTFASFNCVFGMVKDKNCNCKGFYQFEEHGNSRMFEPEEVVHHEFQQETAT